MLERDLLCLSYLQPILATGLVSEFIPLESKTSGFYFFYAEVIARTYLVE
jgi:hypothetical protein